MTMRRHFIPAAALIAALSLTLAGCSGKDESLQPTDTQAAAKERVETLIQEASAVLPAGTTLEYSDGSDENSCDDPTDDGPAGRVFVEHRYKVIAPKKGTWGTADQVISPLVALWEKQGYKVNNDLRANPDPRYNVERSDGYYATVQGYDRNGYFDFTLTAGSPCIWPNGTPQPE
jgi:hypothetical protein